MTTPDRAYVWKWLSGCTDPVVAGVIAPTGSRLGRQPAYAFRYASSYLAREAALSLWSAELPLDAQVHDPTRPAQGRIPIALASCLRDAAPDAWGRRVLNLRMSGSVEGELSELSYLLNSGSDRIGALDFQESPSQYVARDQSATLDELVQLSQLVEAGQAIPESLAAAAAHGTSIGGARPKALLVGPGARSLIAKFSSTDDNRPVVKAEGLAMMLAAHAGIDVPSVEVIRAAGRDVLLIERFDRVSNAGEFTRISMLSMLSVLGESEEGSRYRSYADIAESMRTGPWNDVADSLEQLFTRMVFNILIGNTDDHLRNHAAFWDGQKLSLTPAFDLTPQPRSTNTASHAIAFVNGERASQLRAAKLATGSFNLSANKALEVFERVEGAIRENWDDCADAARLSTAERAGLWGREFLNPYVFYDHP
jgi:serine/threonine-protein kinase HipA